MRRRRKLRLRFSGTTMLFILFVVIGGLLLAMASGINPLKYIYGDTSQDEFYDSEWDEGELPDSIGRYNPERMKFIRENDKRLRHFYGYDSPDIE